MFSDIDKVNLNKFINTEYDFYAHIDKSESKKETLVEHTEACYKYFNKIIKSRHLADVFENFQKLYLVQLGTEGINLFYQMIQNTIIFHDLGKINPYFQIKKMNNKLNVALNSFNPLSSKHSIISAVLYLDYFLEKIKESDKEERKVLRVFAYLNSYVIAKHHVDLGEFYKFLEDLSYEDGTGYKVIEIFKGDTEIYNKNLYLSHKKALSQVKMVKSYLEAQNEEKSIYIYTYERLMYSLLVACDFYATTEFMNCVEIEDLALISEVDEFYDIYKNTSVNQAIRQYEKESYGKHKELNNIKDINILRNEMFLDAESKMVRNIDKDIFYLEAPTGSGKSNVAFNLSFKLIEQNDKLNKIYYVYPYNTLIEQNVETLKGVFADNKEVYSKIAVINSMYPIKMDEKARNSNDELVQLEYYIKSLLNRQFLNYPIILTTHVSLFDTMFNTIKESVLPFHQLANSVIILDEIQSYKNTIWAEIISFLKGFAKVLNIKVIIMSATLPDLDMLSVASNSAVRLIDNRHKYFLNPIFKDRVNINYDLIGKVNTLDELLEYIVKNVPVDKKVLIEFIKKKSAYEFYSMIKEYDYKYNIELITGDDNLSERARILDKVKKDKRILLVATQVIEAGVDIDMDIGFKDISMLDNDEQFMGRINRSCLRKGVVYFFNIDKAQSIYREDVRVNKELTLVNDDMKKVLVNKEFNSYYKPVLALIKEKYNDAFNDSNLHEFFMQTGKLNFECVRDRMKLIDDNKWSMSIFLSRKITVLKDGEELQLNGEEIWHRYKKLLLNSEMEYAVKEVELSKVRSLMNYFIYEINRNYNLTYNDKISELYCIYDGDKYFENNKLNKEKLEHEGELFMSL